MNCATLQSLLPQWRRGTLSAPLEREARAHLAICEECRWLVEAPDPAMASAEALDLTRSILSRTTGRVCDRLQDRLCAFVDGELGPTEAALVQGHLEHCAACSKQVSLLGELQTLLPALAHLDPPPGFTREILGATTGRPAPARDPWQGARDLVARLIRRPRICFEAAYLGTVAGVLFISAPLPNARSFAVVRTVQEIQPKPMAGPLGHAAGRAAQALGDFQAKTGQAVRSSLHKSGTELSEAVSRDTQRWKTFWHRVTQKGTDWFQRMKGSTTEPDSSSLRSAS